MKNEELELIEKTNENIHEMFDTISYNYLYKKDINETIKDIKTLKNIILNHYIELSNEAQEEVNKYIIKQLALLEYKKNIDEVIDFLTIDIAIKIDKKELKKELKGLATSFKELENDLLIKLNDVLNIKETSLSDFLFKIIKVSKFNIKIELLENLILFLDGLKENMPNRYKEMEAAFKKERNKSNHKEQLRTLIRWFNSSTLSNKINSETVAENENYYTFNNASGGEADVALFFINEKNNELIIYYSAVTHATRAAWEGPQHLEHIYVLQSSINKYKEKKYLTNTSMKFIDKKKKLEAILKNLKDENFSKSLWNDDNITFKTENININILATHSDITLVKTQGNIEKYIKFKKELNPELNTADILKNIKMVSQFIFQSSQNSLMYERLMNDKDGHKLKEEHAKKITEAITTLVKNSNVVITGDKEIERVTYSKDLDKELIDYLNFINQYPETLERKKTNKENFQLSHIYFYFYYQNPRKEKILILLEELGKKIGQHIVMSTIKKDERHSSELNKKDEVINKQNNKNLQNYIHKYNESIIGIFKEIDTSLFSIETIYYALTELIKRDKIPLLDFSDYINEFISIDSNNENIKSVKNDITNLLSFFNSTDNLINDLVLTYELNENTTNLLRELIFNDLNKDEINLEEIKSELVSILKQAQSNKMIKTQLILNKIEDLFGTKIKKECIKLFKEAQLNKTKKAIDNEENLGTKRV